jgi:hypothetical protein
VTVDVCPSTYAFPDPPQKLLPASISLILPSSLLGKVEIYVDQQDIMLLMAPANWSCSAMYYVDGSGGITVYPPGESIPSGRPFTPNNSEAVVGTETAACASCQLDQACPLFPSAATANELTYNQPCPENKPSGELVNRLSTTAVGFEDPPGVAGDGNPSGGPYPANGVLTYEGTVSTHGSWLDTCTLPDNMHEVCTASLNYFLQLYGSQ